MCILTEPKFWHFTTQNCTNFHSLLNKHIPLCKLSSTENTIYYINCSGIASGSKLRKMVSHVDRNGIHTCVISFFTNQLTEFAMLQCSMGQGLSILSRNIFGSSSGIFGNFRKHSYDYRTTFSKSSEIGKWSEIFGKSSKTSLLVGL